jgi:hypothetical protein
MSPVIYEALVWTSLDPCTVVEWKGEVEVIAG